MKLSIVTINYNGSEKTIKLLKSLTEQIDKDFQIIVVDNASDEVDFKILSNFVNVSTSQVATLVRSEKNLGFSGGNNVGIQEALKNETLREASGQTDPVKSPNGDNGASWVLLLNNDTWVEAGFMVSLRAKLTALEGFQGESRPNGRSHLGGIVGVPLVEDDHTAYCGKIEWLKPTLRHHYNCNGAHGSDYAIGGAVAIHTDVFNKIGFMDEKYFLYFEDADLSIRAQRAGFRLTFIEEPKAYHQVSSTTKKLGSSLLLRYHYRNALYFNFKNGPWYIKFLVWPWSWWVTTKQVLKIMIYHNRDQSSAILRGVFDFYKNKMGKIQ